MLFSKSFGYVVRSVLYIASVQKEKRYVQLDEIASQLHLPKQFMGRLLKTLAKGKVLTSFKGPAGGFSITEENLQIPLIKLMEITDGNSLENCVIKKRKCNPSNLCPFHDHFSKLREDLLTLMTHTTIGEFVKVDDPDFIRGLSETNGKNGKS
jgi:Rrf2 family transcriptional regulator, iron-sulfur cluster assembly transcription factor